MSTQSFSGPITVTQVQVHGNSASVIEDGTMNGGVASTSDFSSISLSLISESFHSVLSLEGTTRERKR